MKRLYNSVIYFNASLALVLIVATLNVQDIISKFRNVAIFIYGFFIDAVSGSDDIPSNGRVSMNYNFERMWKKAVIPYFKLLSGIYLEKLSKTRKTQSD
jgi:hypothetical protein